MEQSKFIQAINQIADEKGLPRERVVETVEAALAAAYRKDYGEKDQTIKVNLNPETGAMEIFLVQEVVEEVENEESQLTEKEAKKIKKDAKIGDEILTKKPQPEGFGRIAAQTAKQVIMQRIREAERDVLFEEYGGKEGELVNGVVQRIEGRNVIFDIGRANGIMFPGGQVQGERYRIGQRMKILIEKVEQTPRGPQVVISRSNPELIKRLFELEVPEISAGTVEIKSVAREAGSRTKIAVVSTKEEVDPVGSCVGQRGTRVQAVIAELADEKIDCVLYDKDPINFIVNALSPAKVTKVGINEKQKEAKVFVPQDQLSLAIGKDGQNVRLAVKLTGWNIDIVTEEEKAIKSKSLTKGKEEKKTGEKEDKKGAKKESKKLEKSKETKKEDKSTESKKEDKSEKKEKEPLKIENKKEEKKEEKKSNK